MYYIIVCPNHVHGIGQTIKSLNVCACVRMWVIVDVSVPLRSHQSRCSR